VINPGVRDLDALGLPTELFAERLVADLAAGAAAEADQWAYSGALYVAVDFPSADVAALSGGDALIDHALNVLVRSGIGGDRIPAFLQSRWRDINGGTA
jgi:hypothetical protein